MRYEYCVIFFFKRKPAYEIWYGLVGSEMCIMDSYSTKHLSLHTASWTAGITLGC